MGRFSSQHSGWALAYNIRDFQQGSFTDVDLPPPLDRSPQFPPVYFTPQGEPILVNPPLDNRPTVIQVVPHPNSPYSRQFGAGGYRGWNTLGETLDLVEAWASSGSDVVIHPRCEGVWAMGESRGFARFVIGMGLSLFVVREVGLLPDGARLGGESLTGMITTLGVTFPGPEDQYLEYHLIPAEYLIDPYLSGMPSGLTQEGLIYHLPPPPGFLSR